MSAIPESRTGRRSELATLFVAVVVDLLGFGIVIPILANYAERFGAQGLVLGLLLSTFSAVQLVFAPLWGRVSDRMGRRPVLMMCAAGTAMAYLLLGFAESLWLLFVARALGGACAANIATAQAYIADVTTPETRAKGMALIGAGFGLGFTFGPAIAFFFLSFFGVRAPYFVAAAVALANVAWMAVALTEPTRHQRHAAVRSHALTHAVGQPRLAFFLLVFFFVTYGFANIEQTFALFTHARLGFQERENAVVFTYIGVVLTVVQLLFTRRLAVKVGERPLMIAGTCLIGVGAALVSVVQAPWHLVLPITLIASGNALNSPSLMASISRSAPPERQGEMLGLAQSVSSIARILGPMAGAFLFYHVGYASPYVTAAALMFVCSVAIFAYERLTRTE